MFVSLDGPTSGDKTFRGPIGQAIQTAEILPVAQDFEMITEGPGVPELSDDVSGDLSSDQRYIYRMMKAVRDGKVLKELAVSKPGPVCHSRWLTLACRVLRLYVSEHSLDDKTKQKLRDIVMYIMTNYKRM